MKPLWRARRHYPIAMTISKPVVPPGASRRSALRVDPVTRLRLVLAGAGRGARHGPWRIVAPGPGDRGEGTPRGVAQPREAEVVVVGTGAVVVERVVPAGRPDPALGARAAPLADPGAEALAQAALLLVRPQLAHGGVEGGTDEHGEGEGVEPDEQHDRRRQWAVDRRPTKRGGALLPHDERGQQPDQHRERRAWGVAQPR